MDTGQARATLIILTEGNVNYLQKMKCDIGLRYQGKSNKGNAAKSDDQHLPLKSFIVIMIMMLIRLRIMITLSNIYIARISNKPPGYCQICAKYCPGTDKIFPPDLCKILVCCHDY